MPLLDKVLLESFYPDIWTGDAKTRAWAAAACTDTLLEAEVSLHDLLTLYVGPLPGCRHGLPRAVLARWLQQTQPLVSVPAFRPGASLAWIDGNPRHKIIAVLSLENSGYELYRGMGMGAFNQIAMCFSTTWNEIVHSEHYSPINLFQTISLGEAGRLVESAWTEEGPCRRENHSNLEQCLFRAMDHAHRHVKRVVLGLFPELRRSVRLVLPEFADMLQRRSVHWLHALDTADGLHHAGDTLKRLGPEFFAWPEEYPRQLSPRWEIGNILKERGFCPRYPLGITYWAGDRSFTFRQHLPLSTLIPDEEDEK